MAASWRECLPPQAPLRTWTGVEAWWDAVCEKAKVGCPTANLDAGGAWLARRLGGLEPDELQRRRGAELLLVGVALQGDQAAAAWFDGQLVGAAVQALRPMGWAMSDIDEVTQRVREHLWLSKPPKLEGYSGSGPLQAWLRAVVTRQALNARGGVGTSEVSPALLHPGPGPESQLRESQERQALRAALQAAFRVLTARQRTLLRLHGLEQVSLGTIGTMYGKDASTISRWLQAARELVREEVARRLQETLSLDGPAVERLLGEAGVHADATLERLLHETASSLAPDG